MNNLIRFIRYVWSKIRMTKRIYRYGTLGLSVHDDRTYLEKICDKIDKILPKVTKKIKDTSVWHSYFDVATGTYITSMQDIRDIERKRGWTYMSARDLEKENKKQQDAKSKIFSRKTKDHMRNAIREIRQGRSYIKEINDRINKGDYEIGQREVANA